MLHSIVPGTTMDRALGGIFRMGGHSTYEPAVTLGADGKASFRFQIPNNPGLSGETMYLQSMVEDALGDHPTTLTQKQDLLIQ
ncbi:MAG: hypothetical protein ACPG31_04000 [Planctomycetota bacterium]